MAEEWFFRILLTAMGIGVGAFSTAWKMRGGSDVIASAAAVVGTRVHRTEDDIIEIKLELKDLNRKLDMYALLAKTNGKRLADTQDERR